MNKRLTGVSALAAVAALYGDRPDGLFESDSLQQRVGESAGIRSCASCSRSQVLDSGELLVATDASYPPCDFINEDGEIDNYNHDFLMVIFASEEAQRPGRAQRRLQYR